MSADTGICVMNADGTGLTKILDGDGIWLGWPAWSPDATKIVFDWFDPALGTQIFLMNADGTGLVKLTTEGYFNEEPEWSPDGLLIAFSSTRDGNASIYLMRPDGSDVKRVSHPGYASDAWPNWSPDGRRIVFGRLQGLDSISDILVLDLSSGIQKNLTSTSRFSEEWPVWSPNGRSIAFGGMGSTGPPQLYVMRADGNERRQLTDDPPPGSTAPNWQPLP